MTLGDQLFTRLPDPLVFRALAWQYRYFEAELRRIDDIVASQRLAAGTALDVGAWWGPWTYWLARRARHVVTLEPVPHVAAFLREVVPANVEVVTAAASDHIGTTTLYLPGTRRGSEGRSTLERNIAVDGASPVDVDLVTIDGLDLQDLAFVKIDVEGHELAVLQGAERTLTAQRPPVLIEVESRGSVDVHAVFDLLVSFGYSGWFLAEKRWQPIENFDLERHQLATQEVMQSRGFFQNLVRGTAAYVHNFLFTVDPPRRRAR